MGEPVPDLPGNFGEQLKRHRTSAGMTQQDLAQAAGLGTTTVSELERGIALTPQRETVRLLADALELDEPARSAFETAARAGVLIGGAAAPARTLLRDIPSFTGRVTELRQLETSAGLPAEARHLAVHVIEGMGGIGKTSLALHAAHRLEDQFPDGQLFLDLRGYTDGLEPLTSLDALGSLLRWLGVPAQLIPDDLAERAAIYRSRLAGCRTLIVLDNALSAAQVEPLLPGAAGCMVIVTSRKSLRSLDDAQVLSLDELPEPDAVALFRAVARSARIAEDDPAVPEIVRLCGYLPLAVRIAAARMNHRKSLSAGQILDQLRDEHRRLAHLKDAERGIAATFELSYRNLPQAEQDAFRRLGLIPGPDFDAYAAASLLDARLDDAEQLLDALLDHNLLIQGLPGRCRFHDLVRVYVRTLNSAAASPDADAAGMLARLEAYYLHTAQEADRQLEHRIPPVSEPAVIATPRASPPLTTAEQANAWISAELSNLHATASHSAARRPQHAIALSCALAQYLRARGPRGLAMSLHDLALSAATEIGNQPGVAAALSHIGVQHRLAGNLAEAEGTLTRAVGLYAAAGGSSLAGALVELGLVQRLTGAVGPAEESITQALALYAGADDQHGRAGALAELGLIQRHKGEFGAAERSLQTALELYHELGSHYGWAGTLSYLGTVQLAMGAVGPAEASLEEALRLYRELGDPIGQANSLLMLGYLRKETGDLPGAVDALSQARRHYAQFGDRRGEVNAQTFLGSAQTAIGEYEEADRNLVEALAHFREIRDRGGEAEALTSYAALAAAAGSPGQARARYSEALLLARAIPSAKDEAVALEGIGNSYLAEGQTELARDRLNQAMEIYIACQCHADAARVRAALDALAEPGRRLTDLPPST
jgi:tetratricopeptide (TPR) repeat protein/transcriptional regulator with XRE-family HTH domain